MTIRTLPLLSSFSTANLSAPFLSPEMPRDLLDATVVVSVESISGAPSAATLTPKFQIWHSVIGGNQDEVYTGASGTDPTNSWYDIGSAANPGMLPDGDWAAALDVSAAALASPVAMFKTIRGGFPWRLKLNWSLTGGTAPAMKISAIAYCRERFVGGFDRNDSGT
jgi:hypothetical protein